MIVYKDWRGTPIEVGCTVVYAHAQGSSSAHLIEAEVVSVSPMRVRRLNEIRRGYQGRAFNVRKCEPRVVTLTAPLVTVLPLTSV